MSQLPFIGLNSDPVMTRDTKTPKCELQRTPSTETIKAFTLKSMGWSWGEHIIIYHNLCIGKNEDWWGRTDRLSPQLNCHSGVLKKKKKKNEALAW